jgi:V8-like Glu-specific endopeptidase
LVARTQDDPDENAEARGLLGRVFKQRYVNAVNADPKARGLRMSQLDLQRAVTNYRKVYESAPAKHLWHGINTVALVCRAERDGVKLNAPPDPRRLARQILDTIAAAESKAPVYYWDMATAAEASVALGDADGALSWIGKYVQQQDADAFELSSTERQLREVWALTVEKPPGSLLLPLLQSQILQRQGGQVVLREGMLAPTIRAAGHLEKVLGTDGPVTLKWYKQGLDRCRTVAQVRTPTDEGFGTGFLIRGGDLAPALGDELLLLTNAHVISDDPAVQAAEGSLPSAEAVIRFEALESAEEEEFRVAKVLWTSPPDELDATLVRLEPAITAQDVLKVGKTLPLSDGKQKVYVIGHPGGRSLSLSLQDNVLLDYDDRLIHYRTPTEGGSSGSPVFDQMWRLIGLHHAGSLEMPRLKNQPGTYPANEGIWIQKIIAAVREGDVRP